jgi:hypothetical protein
MDAVTLIALKTFGAGLDGKVLVTRFRKRRFSLSVSDRGFEYTPEQSGKPDPWQSSAYKRKSIGPNKIVLGIELFARPSRQSRTQSPRIR